MLKIHKLLPSGGIGILVFVTGEDSELDIGSDFKDEV
ncbi:hypothetical protein BVRB_3g051090 [Beta vulgaris subsp. vulgaris]|uniref:Uncharacterized protein n=1 Tax=Beta vulgaris subsp. vulgaris TaxID=3555 RepID=A0A0J8CSB5_BETVV|nr:hypothetical protein BVRB_3g051090 [Beta vulgaris subsp. vulgaris]